MEKRELSENLDRLAHDVIGAAIEVHRNLGPGFLESVYEEALCIELSLRGIPFERQVNHGIDYKGHRVGDGRLDLVIGNRLVEDLAPIHNVSVLKKGVDSMPKAQTNFAKISGEAVRAKTGRGWNEWLR
jgi:GxxExxY protein